MAVYRAILHVVLGPMVKKDNREAVARVTDGAARGLCDDDLAQIVHDLKNPLSTIALESELLDDSIERLDQHAMCAAVHRIQLNVGFLDRMIQDLLDLCAIDAGQFVLHRRSTELNALIAGVVDRVVATRDRGRVFFDGAEPIVLEIDDLRIERVIANLIQNALKYAPRASGVVVRLSSGSGSACVSVVDAGPGVPEGERAGIFDKYRRAQGATAHNGHGLGLYVSKRIVDEHGGRIGVEPIHGMGSRFFFELPLP